MKTFLCTCLLSIFCLAFTINAHGDEFDAKAAAAAVHVKKLKAHIAVLQGELEQAEVIAKGTKAKSPECVCDNCTCENCVCGATRYAFNPQKGFHLAKNGNYTRYGNGYRQMSAPPMRQASASQMMNFNGNCSNGSCANGQCNTGGFFGRRR